MDEILKRDDSNQSYWPVISCSAVNNSVQATVVIFFESADKIMQHGHSNETSSMVLSHGDIIFSKFDLMKLYFLKFFDILRSESNTTFAWKCF